MNQPIEVAISTPDENGDFRHGLGGWRVTASGHPGGKVMMASRVNRSVWTLLEPRNAMALAVALVSAVAHVSGTPPEKPKNRGGMDWQQAISKALGCKLGEMTYPLEECVQRINALTNQGGTINR